MRTSISALLTATLVCAATALTAAVPAAAQTASTPTGRAPHGLVAVQPTASGVVVVRASATVPPGRYSLAVTGSGLYRSATSTCAPKPGARTCTVTVRVRVAEPGQYRAKLTAGRQVLDREAFVVADTAPVPDQSGTPEESASVEPVGSQPPNTPEPSAPAPAPTPAPAPAPAVEASPSAWDTDMLARVNAVRAGVGAPALQSCQLAGVAAQRHAEDMTARDYFSHTSPEGTNPGSRLGAAGLAARGWGENIAAGYSDVAAVVQGWVDSPGHYRNLVNPSFSHVGFGRADGAGAYGRYWVQVFTSNC